MPRGRKKKEEGFEFDEAAGTDNVVDNEGYDFSEEYRLDPEAEHIAELLIPKYPDELGHIDINKIGFVRKDCKASKGNKKKFAVCKSIKQPTKAFCSKTWIIVTWGDNYRVLPLTIKQRVIFHELLHVPAGCDEGVVDHDVEDFSYCVDRWGSKWHFNIEAPLLVEMEETVDSVLDSTPVDEE